MSTFQSFQWMLATSACLVWILPASRLDAANPAVRTASLRPAAGGMVVDLALGRGGQLAGQLLDSSGRPFPDELVVVQNVSGGQRREARTDSQGQFVVAGLGGGVVQLTGAGTSLLCRCWTHTAAPPAAADRVLLIAGEEVERGQRPIGDLFLSQPILLGLIIAAAIAIPIALYNSRDDDSAS